jgi:alpha-aminoadipate carrier protein LysW
MLTCPVCDADIDIDEEEVDEGESVGCDECGADLKVLGKSPLELSPADQVEDDEDEIFEDDEDLEGVAEEEEEEEEF